MTLGPIRSPRSPLTNWSGGPTRPEWSSSTQNTNLTVTRHASEVVPGDPVDPPATEGIPGVPAASSPMSSSRRVTAEPRRRTRDRGDLAELLEALRGNRMGRGRLAPPLAVEDRGLGEHLYAAAAAQDAKADREGPRHPLQQRRHANSGNAAGKVHPGGSYSRRAAGNSYKPIILAQQLIRVSRRLSGHSVFVPPCVRYGGMAAGVPDAVVAELLGHRRTTMLAHHYAHLNGQAKVLKEAAERVSREKAG